ncbi:MAG: leucyl/phenylalanyl-tRNA--protein transferase [Campylobacterales bacterium]
MIVIREFPPVFLLGKTIEFPDLLDGSVYDDLVCLGGDLSPDRIVTAYKAGLFPWFIENGIPYWFSPDPRMILEPAKIKVSKSLAKTIRNRGFEVRFDTDFLGVMRGCAKPRECEKTTWITDEYVAGYGALFERGIAHSVETWLEGRLVGGLYGLMIGKVFFGESMFALERDASKVAFAALCDKLADEGFDFIDCQISSSHLESLGAVEIDRESYLRRLRAAIS